jgi:uncharacterized lipoprotein YajG
MNISKAIAAISVTLTIIFSGCVVGERTVSLEPDQPAETGAIQIDPSSLKGTVVISSIADNRVFQNKPSDPSMPSIDGDVAEMTQEEQVRMIGRQRGSYGNAVGVTVLPEGDSILIRTRGLIERGFASQGYRASDEPDSTVSAVVAIDQFWAWVTPGMWSIKVEAKVAYTIDLRVGEETKSIIVRGYGTKGSSTAITSKTWGIVYDLAFDDLLKNLETELKALDL